MAGSTRSGASTGRAASWSPRPSSSTSGKIRRVEMIGPAATYHLNSPWPGGLDRQLKPGLQAQGLNVLGHWPECLATLVVISPWPADCNPEPEMGKRSAYRRLHRKSRGFREADPDEIREGCHAACPDVEEAIKWGSPSFMSPRADVRDGGFQGARRLWLLEGTAGPGRPIGKGSERVSPAIGEAIGPCSKRAMAARNQESDGARTKPVSSRCRGRGADRPEPVVVPAGSGRRLARRTRRH